MPREKTEKPVKTVAAKAFSAFITTKVSTDARASANASLGAIPIRGGSVGSQEPSDIFEPVATPPGRTPDSEVARELAKMSKLIQETSAAQDKKLDDIKRSTSAVESKLTEFASRLDTVEGRLDSLEYFSKGLEDVPLATKTELENLREKLDDIENRERRLNLKFIGFSEKCEGRDARAFLGEAIQKIWNIDFPQGLEIDRAHRLGAVRHPVEGQPRPKPRPIIAKFLRYQDKERIVEAARKAKGTWDGKNIMVFPDYSKIVNDKRALFNSCKKLLHQRKMKFSLVFPAILVIHGDKENRRSFDDHKKALSYINSLG